jgi:hypothetical protein
LENRHAEEVLEWEAANVTLHAQEAAAHDVTSRLKVIGRPPAFFSHKAVLFTLGKIQAVVCSVHISARLDLEAETYNHLLSTKFVSCRHLQKALK